MYGRNAKKRTMTFDEENQHGVKVPKTVRFVKTEKLGISSYPSVSTSSQRAATRKASRRD
jgi:hypothetical protein